jgi:hypothetical protein
MGKSQKLPLFVMGMDGKAGDFEAVAHTDFSLGSPRREAPGLHHRLRAYLKI